MISTRWRKIINDLWGNKTRTILVILSIAVGVFAVGMIASSRIILSRDMTESYLATNPAQAILFPGGFDDDLVQVVQRMDEVQDAEGRTSIGVRIQTAPEQWKDFQLTVIGDYNDIRIDKIWQVRGAWPPGKRELLLERGALAYAQAEVGDTLLMEMPDGERREIRVAGVAHDVGMPSPLFAGRGAGYITFETFEWLGMGRFYDELRITVNGDYMDKGHVQDVTNLVRDKIERGGQTVYWTWVPEPGKHPADEIIQPMFLLLGALGFLSLPLSGFLVVNIISALLAQQIRQIGMMKAIGARTEQVIGMYLGMVMIFGILSLLVAAPLGAAAAYAFSSYMAGLLNVDITSAGIPLPVLALEIAVGLIAPLIAALYPVIAGARITVREALSSYGIGGRGFGAGLLDRVLVGAQRAAPLQRPLLLSLRNTFRRKGRLALTLMTLVLASAIFVGIFSVRASLLTTLDEAFEYWNYDIEVNFRRPHRIDQLVREAHRVPGVAGAECWCFHAARRIRADGTESDNINMVAPDAQTDMLQPTIIKGRWLLPEDENAVVLNTEVTKDDPDIKVGDDIVLKIDNREDTWRVVGIVRGVMTGRIAYANYSYFSRYVRYVDRATELDVVTTKRDPLSIARVAQDIQTHFEHIGLEVRVIRLISEYQQQAESQINVIVVFLSIMATLLAIVGGLGLMGTMSINVLERTREIGVMRAIGASDGSVLQIVLVEGVIIGALSWFIGAALALPLGKVLSDAVGTLLVQSELTYTFSVSGALLWFFVVTIIAAVASFLPARSASRVTVRDALAYE